MGDKKQVGFFDRQILAVTPDDAAFLNNTPEEVKNQVMELYKVLNDIALDYSHDNRCGLPELRGFIESGKLRIKLDLPNCHRGGVRFLRKFESGVSESERNPSRALRGVVIILAKIVELKATKGNGKRSEL